MAAWQALISGVPTNQPAAGSNNDCTKSSATVDVEDNDGHQPNGVSNETTPTTTSTPSGECIFNDESGGEDRDYPSYSFHSG